MAKKKNNVKKIVKEKTTMIKIAEKVGELAGRIANEKDHLVAMAGNAMESVKTAVQHISKKKKPAAKKAVKKIEKKVTKKIVRPVAKKINKAAVVKKVASAKKVVKKAVKKAAKNGK